MKLRIYPYKMASQSARILAENFSGAKRVRENGNYRGYRSHLLVNWGNPRQPPNGSSSRVGALLNSPEGVAAAGCKLTTFRALAEAQISTPPFTESRETVEQWLNDEYTVVARTLTRASEGRGIVVLNHGDTIPSAPLYTQYVKKAAEYRVHVFNGKVIRVQQKRRRTGFENVNQLIRNYNNGWVFCTEDVTPDRQVLDESIKAIEIMGLDFGAVDVIWNNHYKKAYVLEVNTAPGIEGSTLTAYVNAIKELL